MTDVKEDILSQYHHIANKLKKKRILKKPNLAEASQQFETLGANCEREGLTQYTGLCFQAASKCQNTLKNYSEETLLLLKSSRQFMNSYLEENKDGFVPNSSLLLHSYMLYKECLAKLSEYENFNKYSRSVIMGNIALEMGDNLSLKANLPAEGCQEYEVALSYFSNYPVEKINCLKKIISLKIQNSEFKESLKLVNDIIEETKLLPASGLKETTLRDAEIIRIFLLLILRPTIQQISPESAAVLEKYAWVETSSSNDVQDLSVALQKQGLSMLGENLFLNLQSLVMACQYSDIESLEHLEKDLLFSLTTEQKALLRILVKQYKS